MWYVYVMIVMMHTCIWNISSMFEVRNSPMAVSRSGNNSDRKEWSAARNAFASNIALCVLQPKSSSISLATALTLSSNTSSRSAARFSFSFENSLTLRQVRILFALYWEITCINYRLSSFAAWSLTAVVILQMNDPSGSGSGSPTRSSGRSLL